MRDCLPRIPIVVLVLSVGVLAFVGPVPVIMAQASFQGLGDLPGGEFASEATAVSADGSTAVGVSIVGASSRQGFRWTQSQGMTALQIPEPGWRSVPRALSADGSVVVGDFINVNPEGDAFRWVVGTPEVTRFWGSASAISGGGSVVAGSNLSGAFHWTQASGVTYLGALPGGDTRSAAYGVSGDGTVIVGQGTSATGWEAFRWTQDTGMVGLGDLAGGIFDSRALAASAHGSVVVGSGSSEASGSGHEAFRWTTDAGMLGLGDLPGGAFNSQAKAVSADGSVVVGWGTTNLGNEAFIWDPTHGVRNLLEVLSTDYGLSLAGWRLTEAVGVSGDGLTIVGTGVNPDGNLEAWIARVPEPSSVLLLTIMIGFVVTRRGAVRAQVPCDLRK